MPFKSLDADFYPHIIDWVFAYASPPALLALRVNREWRRRAERQLAYHVSLVATQDEEPPSEITYSLTSAAGWIGRFKNADVADFNAPVPSFLSSTAAVDLNFSKFNEDVACLLQHVPRNVTYRCPEVCDLSELQLPPRSRVVLLARDIFHHLDILDASSSYFAKFRLDDTVAVKKHLVLHVRRATGEAERFNWMCLGDLASLTLVMHPWRWSSDRIPRYTFELFAELVIIGWLQSVPVTVVNFDFSEFEAEFPQVGSVKDTVMEHVEYRKAGYVNTHPHPDGPRFLTLDEYRAEVGDDQFEIDTCGWTVQCPELRSTL